MKRRTILTVLAILLTMTLVSTASAQDDDKQYIIGNLILVGNDGFVAEMANLGYVEGQNTTYLYVVYPEDWSQWQAEYERQVKEMLDAGVEIFVVNSDTDAVALKAMVGDIPIVFARSDNPVTTTAVADLVTPGGTMTGIVTNKHHERRLQLLTEVKPDTDKVYYLYTTYNIESATVLEQVKAVAAGLDVEIVVVDITAGVTLETVENIPEGTDWVFIPPFVYPDAETNAAMIAKMTELNGGIAYYVDIPTQGYIISYGPNLDDTGRQAAQIIDRILRGASPADLPVQTAENFLTINLEAAEAAGIDVPEGVLRQANNIIRPGYFESLITPTPES